VTYVVLSHVLDEAADVYRLVVAEAVLREPADDAAPSETVYVNAEEFVFDATDDRWHRDGERRGPEKVAAEQRRIVRDALAERERAAEAPPAVELPGAGDAL
jgi:hypothetical protein